MPHTWFQGFSSYCTAVPTLQALKCNMKVQKQSELDKLHSIECKPPPTLGNCQNNKIWVTNFALDCDLACSLTLSNKNIIISPGLQTFPTKFHDFITHFCLDYDLNRDIFHQSVSHLFGAAYLQFPSWKPVHSFLSYFANRQTDKQNG